MSRPLVSAFYQPSLSSRQPSEEGRERSTLALRRDGLPDSHGYSSQGITRMDTVVGRSRLILVQGNLVQPAM